MVEILSDTIDNLSAMRVVVFRVYVPRVYVPQDIAQETQFESMDQFNEYRYNIGYLEAQSEDGLPDYAIPSEWEWHVDPANADYLIGTRLSHASTTVSVVYVDGSGVEPDSELIQFRDAKKHAPWETRIPGGEHDKDVCFYAKEHELRIGRYRAYGQSVVLNQDMMRALLPFLQHFAAHGTFEPKKEDGDEEANQ